ncbi:stage V sporulation protein AA [Paenibacillus sp. y28]|uniref:stage V sporulation protein AA n=1 Tax=Paenibacillus sp. y28 TaxID=3129110 RepID=UPI00301819F0
MTSRFPPVLYLRLRRRVLLEQGKPVLLGRIAQLIVDPELEPALSSLFIYEPKEQDGPMILIDMMRIVEQVKRRFPELQIEHYGEPHTLIEIKTTPAKPNMPLMVLVWLLLFVGSGLAIMNFHADVSMREVHVRLHELVTGQEPKHLLWLQIPYSIGLGGGMVIFFNQLFQKKISEEPSPLEVEMFMYQENLNHYVVTCEYEKSNPSAQEGEKPS